MMQNGFVLGGEQSGHIIFSKHARTGDGILTSLMLMEVMLEKKADTWKNWLMKLRFSRRFSKMSA